MSTMTTSAPLLTVTVPPRSVTTRATGRFPQTAVLVAADIAGVGLGSLLGSAVFLRSGASFNGLFLAEISHLVPVLVVSSLVTLCAYGLYRRPLVRIRPSASADLGRFVHAWVAAGFIAVFGTRLLGGPRLAPTEVGLVVTISSVMVAGLRPAFSALSQRNALNRDRILIVGTGGTAEAAARRLGCLPNVDVVGSVANTAQALGPLEQLAAITTEYSIHRIVIAAEGDKDILAGQLRSLSPQIKVSIIPPLWDHLNGGAIVEDLDGVPVFDLPSTPAGRVQHIAKRLFDIVFCTLVLVLSLPFTLAIGLAIKVASPGPVFFRQTRIGREGRPFVMFKFRTMTYGAESEIIDLRDQNDGNGVLFKLRHDPRVTGIGRVLRQLSIDELPQLMNVVKGDMSLVGPRPFIPIESEALTDWSARRFEVRPGMTGQWQVSGRSDASFEELQLMDFHYVASWSLWWDMRILWKTPRAVLSRIGAY